MRNWIKILLFGIVLLVLGFVYSLYRFYSEGADKYASDYLMFDPIYLNNEITLIDVPISIDRDTLDSKLKMLLDLGTRCILLDNEFLLEGDYSQQLHELLRSRKDILIFSESFMLSQDYTDIEIYGFSFLSRKVYDSEYELITSFEDSVLRNDAGHIDYVDHIAVKSLKVFHPRFQAFFNKKKSKAFEMRYFGDDRFFSIVKVDSLLSDQTNLENRMVIIGDTSHKVYYTPMRYVMNEPNSKPDMSKSSLLGNAVLSIINYDLIE